MVGHLECDWQDTEWAFFREHVEMGGVVGEFGEVMRVMVSGVENTGKGRLGWGLN